jgi:YD repeat-containing protein
MSDREEAGLRGPVRTCLEETVLFGGSKYLTTAEYSSDGRLLTFRTTNPDGSEGIRAQTYDAAGRLAKIISGNIGEPSTETLYMYDETGRLLTITNGPKKGGRIDFYYDEHGRKTTIQSFDPKTLSRGQNSSLNPPWDAVVRAGVAVPVGGKIITIYDENDQPTEAQIRDAEDHTVRRLVRTYDANGRMVEENPFLMMNNEMGALLGGKEQAGTSTSYTYDAQNRITKRRKRNMIFETTATILYNDHGDKAEERTTFTKNSAMPIGSAGAPKEDEIHYTYQYDSYGNWMEQTVYHGSQWTHIVKVIFGVKRINVHHRKLTYY